MAHHRERNKKYFKKTRIWKILECNEEEKNKLFFDSINKDKNGHFYVTKNHLYHDGRAKMTWQQHNYSKMHSCTSRSHFKYKID